jgi:hypothetical protein
MCHPRSFSEQRRILILLLEDRMIKEQYILTQTVPSQLKGPTMTAWAFSPMTVGDFQAKSDINN